MMSEQRYKLSKINPTVNPFDTVYFIIDFENPSNEIRSLGECVGLLNEQQNTIDKLIEELELTANTKLFSRRELERKVKEQAETIRKQSIRIYCQDKEVQRLLGELEKIPKNIREVWLE